jgi:methane monooxygenase PmoA-like
VSWKSKANQVLSVVWFAVCAANVGGCDTNGMAGSQALEVERTKSEIIVRIHGRPGLIYQLASGWKPYIKEYRNASGINVIRDSPPDHRHHHGIMFAVWVDGVNFWEEQEGSGRQEDRGLLPVVEGAAAGVSYVSFGQDLAWTRPGDSRSPLQERRRLAVCAAEEFGATLTDWRSVLTVPPGREGVVLSGPRYVGVGVRFMSSMDDGGQFRNANGQSGARGTDGAEAGWTAYTGSVGRGRVATVAVFGDPKTLPVWFILGEPFAYVSATMGLDRKPLRLPRNGRLEVRYGFAVWDTNPKPSQIQALYERWQTITQTLPQ